MISKQCYSKYHLYFGIIIFPIIYNIYCLTLIP